MARRRGGKKGNPFERKICDKLSKWWCGNDDDRIFWRTAGSGAMATVRKKKGKNTQGHHGDLCAIHPSGKPFTDLLAIEMKKGYSTHTMHELIDRPDTSVPKEIEGFIAKARRAMRETQAFAWMVIHERDRRKCLVYFPHRFMQQLVNSGCFPKPPCPFVTIDTIFRDRDKPGKKIRQLICVTTLAKFLKQVTPDHIRHLARHLV